MTVTTSSAPRLRYGTALEREVGDLAPRLARPGSGLRRQPNRWIALQLLEGDLAPADVPGADTTLAAAVDAARHRLAQDGVIAPELAIADARYQFARAVTAATVAHHPVRRPLSDRVDGIATHPWVGPLLFLGVMYLLFTLVQNVSAPYVSWIDEFFAGPVASTAIYGLAAIHAPAWLTSLVVDGMLAGVGGVLAFLPSLLILYLTLGVLEESGYLARAAFVMDRFLTTVGLHGKSFVPLILGFGCNVPAIYATRTIESPAARRLTGLLVPFMSCTARLPVYVIFSIAFFPNHAGVVIFGLYLFGIAVAAIVAAVLARTLFAGETPGILILELPPYRAPRVDTLVKQTGWRAAGFVRKAGTLILVMSVLLWVLLHLPWGVETPRQSLFGRTSAAIAPVFTPAGFGDWRATGALVSGVMAKEVVVSTLAQIHLGAEPAGDVAPRPVAALQASLAGLGAATIQAGQGLLESLTPGVQLFPAAAEEPDPALATALQGAFTPLAALAFLIFVALYVPCVATIGAQVDEFGGRWALFSVVLTLVVPWVAAVLVFQGGRLLGMG